MLHKLLRRRRLSEAACPSTNTCRARRRAWRRWVFPVAGLISLAWFLVRVLPKPARAAYPCQRAAAPLASGFILWLLGLGGAMGALGKARGLWRRTRPIPAMLCLALGLALLGRWDRAAEPAAGGPFVPSDPPNAPMGLAVGVQPGRVVWIHDPNVTDWDGQAGTSWAHTDTVVLERMTSDALRWLTGQSTDAAAWDALFRDLNRRRGRGDAGYGPGQKIAVKVNQVGSDAGGSEGRDTTPMAVRALLGNLVAHAGVSPADITVYDASMAIKDPWFNYVTNSGRDFVGMRFVCQAPGPGRLAPAADAASPVYFSLPAFGATAYLPTCVTQADYLINMAALKPHWLVGATLSGKNHFGSVRYNGQWLPEFLHPYMRSDAAGGPVYGQYNCIVDLMGHAHLGGKTVLYFLDGLYSPRVHQGSPPARWQSAPFANRWTASILLSQDGVALDSVGVDMLRAEHAAAPMPYFVGDVDSYLHEAALAFAPPSGVLYNSNQAPPAVPFASLGVHEHWNNAVDRQYTRNLGTGLGIELIRQAPPPGPPGAADFNGDGVVNGRDFLIWQAHYPMAAGATRADGDANGDGAVNGRDFLLWQAAYRPAP